jgi:hypothetical protein
MYYPDLMPYRYATGGNLAQVLNIGWLDDSHDYPVGRVPDTVVSKLKQLLLTNRDVNKVSAIKGCPFCGVDVVYVPSSDARKLLGMSEIWIPGKTGTIYAAPSLVYHYITKHEYLPPQEFLAAVEDFDLAAEINLQNLFDNAVNGAAPQV